MRPPDDPYNISCVNFTIVKYNPDTDVAQQENDMYSRQLYFLHQMALGTKTPCENDPSSDDDIYDWSRNDSFHCWDMAAAAQSRLAQSQR